MYDLAFLHRDLNRIGFRVRNFGISHKDLGLRAWEQVFPDSRYHTVKYDPFIKSQLVSGNQLSDLMWCNFGHATPQMLGWTKFSYSTEWVQGYLAHQKTPQDPPRTLGIALR